MRTRSLVMSGVTFMALTVALMPAQAHAADCKQATPWDKCVDPTAGATTVSPDDPIMQCQGDRLPKNYHYDCHVYSSTATSKKRVTMQGSDEDFRVTNDVYGCHKGNQPSASKTQTYSKGTTIGGRGGIKTDILKNFKNIGKIFDALRLIGPQLEAQATYSETTTYGVNDTKTITANPGYLAWGVFVPYADEATVNMVVEITNTDIGGRGPVYYKANGVTVTTPIVDKTTNQGLGALRVHQEKFKDVADFNAKCPGGDLPDYLGGNSRPGPKKQPQPSNSSGTKSAAADNADKIVTEGVHGKAIKNGVDNDLHSRIKNLKTAITNKQNVTQLVSDARRAVSDAKSASTVNADYASKLDRALAAVLTAK